jgi:hypothetical protein
MCALLIAMESDMNAVTAPTQRKVGFPLGLGIFFIPLIFAWFLLRRGHTLLARILGFAWLALSLLVYIGSPSTPPGQRSAPVAAPTAASAPASAQASAPVEQLKAYTAVQVASSYDENTVAADILFKGKKVKVSGRITDINTDFMGNPYLVLAGKNEFLGPQFKFDKADIAVMATLKKGASVQVVCTGIGDVIKTPMFEDCQLSN